MCLGEFCDCLPRFLHLKDLWKLEDFGDILGLFEGCIVSGSEDEAPAVPNSFLSGCGEPPMGMGVATAVDRSKDSSSSVLALECCMLDLYGCCARKDPPLNLLGDGGLGFACVSVSVM